MPSLRLFLILLCLLLPLSQGWFFRGRRSTTSVRRPSSRTWVITPIRTRFRIRVKIQGCSTKTSCISCASRNGLFGLSCRWCPKDNKCHAPGAVFTNPCSRAENVVTTGGCSNIVRAIFDRNLAYKMVFLSALAYADNVANYIAKATEVNTFRLVKQVTKSCPWNAKCSGYTAVSHTEKAIVITFRGSQHLRQVANQAFKTLTHPKVSFQAGGKVQAYFNDEFLKIWKELKSDAYNQISNYPTYKVWVTGHSLGGAMASLASTVIANDGKTTKNNLFLYTFGQPRVGNYDYALKHDKLVPISFRITHYRDPVVHLPPCNKAGPICVSFTGGPYHHGKEIYYGEETMTKYSSYKKCEGKPYNEDLSCSNNLVVITKCVLNFKKCTDDHEMYFGINVGGWWKN